MIRILSFGEILWDLFPAEKKIGGAPFNFSAHIQKLGASVTFVSAVGADPLGAEALNEIRARGIDPSCVAVLSDYPTGYCSVSLNGNAPQYDLAYNVAYDRIPYPSKKALHGSFDALYLGTLASRHPSSNKTKWKLLRAYAGQEKKVREVFFDINIRGEFWSRRTLSSVLPFVTILKYSREEIYAFGSGDEDAVCRSLFEKYPNLKLIIVTRDKDGARVYDRTSRLESERPKSAVVSTVGAGDSFSACFLYNYLCGQPLSVCLNRAVLLSDFVVTQLGAIPDYPDELFSKIR